MVAGLLGALLSTAAVTNAGATTSTTQPGPAPNQSQINATQSQVSQIESTLAQEEQQTSILDDKYNTAQEDLQNAQTALQTIGANLTHARSEVDVDRRLVAKDAVQAYVYGTPQTGFASYFSSSATQNLARNQYTSQIVGNLTKDETALLQSETQLQTQEAAQQSEAAQAQSEAAQAKSLAQANEQEAAATKATLNQVQGQLAQEVAQAAIQEAQQEAAAAAAARERSGQTTGRCGGSHGGDGCRCRRRIVQRCRRDDCGQPGGRSDRSGRRLLAGRKRRHGCRAGRRLPTGRALCLRRRAAGGGLRLLGTRPMGLGPGRRLHTADDRDRMARPDARLTRCAATR